MIALRQHRRRGCGYAVPLARDRLRIELFGFGQNGFNSWSGELRIGLRF